MKDPAFPFYAQDFLTGVMHFSMAERGMYITLLAYQWAHGKIPKKRLGFILGSDWVDSWVAVGEKFIDIDDEFVINPRLEEEREKRARFKEKQVENGKMGGRKPKLKPNESQTLTQSESQIKPLENEYENDNTEEKGKEGMGEKPNPKIPDVEDFVSYALSKDPQLDESHLRLKYDAWKVDNWKNGNGKPIKNWKAALNNTIPFIKKKNTSPAGNIKEQPLIGRQSADTVQNNFNKFLNNGG